MENHVWAMWHPFIGPRMCNLSKNYWTTYVIFPVNISAMCHTCHVRCTGVPCVTLAVVTCVTPGLVQLCLPCHPYVLPVTLPCVTSRSFHVSCIKYSMYAPTVLPCHIYDRTTCTINCHVALYGLYSQHCFCLFGKMNKTRYQEHTTSV
jgi:hypothetical protein